MIFKLKVTSLRLANPPNPKQFTLHTSVYRPTSWTRITARTNAFVVGLSRKPNAQTIGIRALLPKSGSQVLLNEPKTLGARKNVQDWSRLWKRTAQVLLPRYVTSTNRLVRLLTFYT